MQPILQRGKSRDILAHQAKVSLNKLGSPLAISSEKFIAETIEKDWQLTNTLVYILQYMGGSKDECSHYYYYEAIFSQPTASYPIPQATVSVFFRVQDSQLERAELRGVPGVTFRIEGQNKDHDVRFVKLTADWILAVIMMKIKLFRRIEKLRLF